MEYLLYDPPEEGFDVIEFMGEQMYLLGLVILYAALVYLVCWLTYRAVAWFFASEERVTRLLAGVDSLFGSINETLSDLGYPRVDPWLGG